MPMSMLMPLPHIPLADITADITAITVLKLPNECELSWDSVEE